MSAILSRINVAHFSEPPADLLAFTVGYDVLFDYEILSCLQTQIGRRQKYLIRVHLLLTYQASCPASSMIDELVLLSVSNNQVPVLHNFEAKMKRTSTTR